MQGVRRPILERTACARWSCADRLHSEHSRQDSGAEPAEDQLLGTESLEPPPGSSVPPEMGSCPVEFLACPGSVNPLTVDTARVSTVDIPAGASAGMP